MSNPTAHHPRQGEADSNFERTDRIYSDDQGWHLRTREGISVGPYLSHFDACLAASLLVSKLSQLDTDSEPRNAILDFSRDPSLGPWRRTSVEAQEEAVARLRELQRHREGSLGTKILGRLRSAIAG